MRNSILVLVLLVSFALSNGGLAQTTTSTVLDSGHFVFMTEGTIIAYEYFGLSQQPDGSYDLSSTSVHLGSGTLNRLQTLKLDSQFRPISYNRLWVRRENPAIQLETTFSGNTATLRTTSEGETEEETFTTATEFALIDSGAISQGIPLKERFALSGDDIFTFDALNPLNAIILESNIRYEGTATLRADGTVFTADETIWTYTFDDETAVVHIFTVDGRIIHTIEVAEGESPFIGYRGDLYPNGIEVDGF